KIASQWLKKENRMTIITIHQVTIVSTLVKRAFGQFYDFENFTLGGENTTYYSLRLATLTFAVLK
ncbi:hypothetical protein FB192DRAFT_1272616, partial [Mucor lusitanicus]